MTEHDEASTDMGGSVPLPRDQSESFDVNRDISPDTGSRLLIDLDILGGMTQSAIVQYKVCTGKFATALAREASRLEEADRAEEIDSPEITTSMVVKANDLLRHPPSTAPSTSIPIIITQAVSFALGIGTPIIFGAGLPHPWQWTATIACGTLAVACQIYAILAVRRK